MVCTQSEPAEIPSSTHVCPNPCTCSDKKRLTSAVRMLHWLPSISAETKRQQTFSNGGGWILRSGRGKSFIVQSGSYVTHTNNFRYSVFSGSIKFSWTFMQYSQLQLPFNCKLSWIAFICLHPMAAGSIPARVHRTAGGGFLHLCPIPKRH